MIFSSFEFVLAVIVGWIIVFFMSRLPRAEEEEKQEPGRRKKLFIEALISLIKGK